MASGDFVVNVTSDVFRDDIETVALEGPPESDEFELAGLTPVPATKVTSPAIGEALARLECVVHKVVDLGTPDRIFGEVHLVIGKVVWVAYDSAICNERGRIDPLRLGAISRLGLRTFLRTVPEGAYFPAPDPLGRVHRRRRLDQQRLAGQDEASANSPDPPRVLAALTAAPIPSNCGQTDSCDDGQGGYRVRHAHSEGPVPRHVADTGLRAGARAGIRAGQRARDAPHRPGPGRPSRPRWPGI